MASKRSEVVLPWDFDPDEDPFNRYFRAQVYTLRRQRKWSPDRLAVNLRLAGWTSARPETVGQIEKGKHPLTPGEIILLADVLDVPVEDLFGRPAESAPRRMMVEDLDDYLTASRAVYKALVATRGGQRLTSDEVMTACWGLLKVHLDLDEEDGRLADVHSIVAAHVMDILADVIDDHGDWPTWTIPTQPVV